MVKKIAAVALMSAFAASAFAAGTPVGTAEDSVKWQVTAMKDSKAGLVVSPIGSIDFKYSVVSAGFVSAPAKFLVTTLNGFADATEFKLEATQGSGFANSVADSSKGFKVELQKDGQPLSVDSASPTLLKTSTAMGDFLGSLDGLSAEGSEQQAEFTAVAVKGSDEFKALPDGAYMGEATAAFRATWSK
ncbi:MAG: common pilus major fimbrillin subunit EcpA [Iodobacter sp.]